MRYLAFTLWAAITLVLIGISFSSFVFGSLKAREFGIHVALAIVWPIALLSRDGRRMLKQIGRSA
jgi:hypothetical protein